MQEPSPNSISEEATDHATLARPYIKGKIGSHLSYPLKFGELQSLLSTVFTQRALRIRFWDYKAPRQNERRESYPVLKAEYSLTNREPNWALFIYPIPREFRHTVHSLLPPLIGQMEAWFLSDRLPIWHSSSHALFFDFLPDQQQIITRTFDKFC